MSKKTKIRQSSGSGTYRERADGKIEYRVSYGYDISGKLIRKSFYGKTEIECRFKKKEYEKQNAVPIEKVYTVAEWAQRWLLCYKKSKAKGKKKCGARMYKQYEDIVNNCITPNIGRFKLTAVKPAHIVELMDKYVEKSDSYVKKIMMTVRGIFETAIDNDLCSKNPARNVKVAGVKGKEKEIFTLEEIAIIVKYCLTERSNISDAMITLLNTGLRREELLGLMWCDIDFPKNTISICRTVVMEISVKAIKEETKSEESERKIPMLPITREILISRQHTSEFVFPNINGDYQNPEAFSRAYKRLINRINRLTGANVRQLPPHCCRHTFATYLSAHKIDIKIIQALLGHADIKMTSRYTHNSLDGMKNALQGFDYFDELQENFVPHLLPQPYDTK